MPVMDGFECLRALKNDSSTIEIPVIVLSGNTNPEDKVKAFELGAMDFVCKPFDIHELRARIGSAIRLHRLMKMLENRARIDGLTGLWNRAYFNERLGAELDNVSRTGSKLALALCDLDHFKKLNDTFGHPAGDAVLQGFAAVLGAELRSYDVACRYGGEEFAIILPDTDVEQARVVCDRIRQALEARRWPTYPEIRATASFGITVTTVEGQVGAQGWIEASDRALYASKQAGRNRVTPYAGQAAAEPKPLKRAG
jgi:diguanylate cyclase (GGDEF)-like protein